MTPNPAQLVKNITRSAVVQPVGVLRILPTSGAAYGRTTPQIFADTATTPQIRADTAKALWGNDSVALALSFPHLFAVPA
jgi:hypothetical protein